MSSCSALSFPSLLVGSLLLGSSLVGCVKPTTTMFITVTSDPGIDVYQLGLDFAYSNTTKSEVRPDPASSAPITFPTNFSAILVEGTSSVTLDIQGLDIDGTEVSFGTGSTAVTADVQTNLTVNLSAYVPPVLDAGIDFEVDAAQPPKQDMEQGDLTPAPTDMAQQDACPGADLGGDIFNCGGCNRVCSGNNVDAPMCVNGVCVGTCNSGFADCDGDMQKNGCEASILDDATHCGGCGNDCTKAPNVNGAFCANEVCMASCNTGFADCNGNLLADGCEANVGTDPLNCGGCGMACPAMNLVPACTAGVCSGVCNTGFGDCDGDKRANGCEAATTSDANNCGACGQKCATNNVAVACVNSVCSGTCAAGYADCNNDKKTDGCETLIGGTDVNNCGGCKVICSANQIQTVTCDAGKCDGACEPGFGDCNGDKQKDGCETNITSDVNNCGACQAACSQVGIPSRVCAGGVCQGACAPGFDDCNLNKLTDGCEVSTLTDPVNCGGCGVTCNPENLNPACSGGVCSGTCNSNFADCNGDKLTDGCETDLRIDPSHCGACNRSCSKENISNPTCSGSICNGVCDPGFGDCNSNKLSDGCEHAVDTDAVNCGGCGVLCSTNHISARSCAGGQCNGTCSTGFGDCDGSKLINGCETSLLFDASNCGACGAVCSNNNVLHPNCSNGKCNGACSPGFSDCNADELTDGCETSTSSDPMHCGGCTVTCSANHISNPTCTSGLCSGVCDALYADCDGNLQANGCETSVDTDLANCGGCRLSCSANHIVTVSCGGGVCNGACKAGFGDCNNNRQSDGCETNILSSIANCGGCGMACSGNNVPIPACTNGMCNGTCAAGFLDCNGSKLLDGCESQVSADPLNCGGCGKACSTNHITATCTNSVCGGTCDPGYSDCDGDKTNGCETATGTDPNHCGACATACSNSHIATPTCDNGICDGACDANFADCDGNKQSNGCEKSVASDVNNCGGCGFVCSSENVTTLSCVNGKCNGACASGFTDCNHDELTDGCESNVQVDPNNCGVCGAVCSAVGVVAATCSAGACTSSCAPGYNDCNLNKSDGCEAHFPDDPLNCGSCNTICSNSHITTPTCGAGVCNGDCDQGYADCNANKATDGCERDVRSDINNCGGCGSICSGTNIVTIKCDNGACDGTCVTGYADCDGNKQTNGCEKSVSTDTQNCGGCGVTCSTNNIASSCISGKCSGGCNTGFYDCNNDLQSDGCESQVAVDPKHCGSCATVCSTNHINATCGGGLCNGTCVTGFTDCDNDKLGNGCEVNTGTDPNTCGGCNKVCPKDHITTPTCFNSLCNGACDPGWADCDNDKFTNGCETFVGGSDITNCGGCGVICSSNGVNAPVCVSGTCLSICKTATATSAPTDCNNNRQTDGCETDIKTDANHCGSCATVCSNSNVTPACSMGVCSGMCASGWADCNANKQKDGCESFIATDTKNCGGCGMACSTANLTVSCSAGVCNGTCNANFADCNGNIRSDGCEVNLMTDNNHCGSCTGAGVVCSTPTFQCGGGVCKLASGQPCVSGGACASGVCTSNHCM